METYVDRKEFELLKEEVKEIKVEMSKNATLLYSIDKKLDVINEKILNTSQIEELKFKPLTEKVEKVENNQSWLWKSVIGTTLGLAIKILFDFKK